MTKLINGKEVAQKVIDECKVEIAKLKERGVTPLRK